MECPYCYGAVKKTDSNCANCGRELFQKNNEEEYIEETKETSEEQPFNCLRCHIEMTYEGINRLQRSSGASNFFLGEFGDILHGTLDLKTYTCPKCGTMEFRKVQY